MSKLHATSIRLPVPLLEQIEQRRRYSKRSLNQEITYLLERAIDRSVADTMAAMPKKISD